jgi:hypothetical protein
MKKGKHLTFNIQHSTPKDCEAAIWEFNESPDKSRKFDLEDRLLEFASAVIDLSESLPAQTIPHSPRSLGCWALNVKC